MKELNPKEKQFWDETANLGMIQLFKVYHLQNEITNARSRLNQIKFTQGGIRIISKRKNDSLFPLMGKQEKGWT